MEETGVAAGSAALDEDDGWISVTGTRMLRGKKGIVLVPVGTSSRPNSSSLISGCPGFGFTTTGRPSTCSRPLAGGASQRSYACFGRILASFSDVLLAQVLETI